jgi:anti-anti-sigma factor
MNLELLTREGSFARLTCAGDITPNLGPGSGNPMEDLLGPGCYGYKAIMSLERATYINSSGVGWLVGCHRNFERAGGKMVLYSIPPMIDHVLKLLKMDKLLHIVPDEHAAAKLIEETGS